MPRTAAVRSSVPRTSAPIPRQSLSAAVLERLRESIISGEFHEGAQLRQDAIAAEFQVSRVPVREALTHLAAEGLITIVANRGAVVSALSPGEIAELFETRAVLECHMFRQAIPNFSAADFQRAEEILKEFEHSLEKESEMQRWGRMNWSFHSALYAPANRPVMMAFLKTSEQQLRPLHAAAPGIHPQVAPSGACAPQASRSLQERRFRCSVRCAVETHHRCRRVPARFHPEASRTARLIHFWAILLLLPLAQLFHRRARIVVQLSREA